MFEATALACQCPLCLFFPPKDVFFAFPKKECLAIQWGVDSVRYYLLGCPFTLCSFHAPLQWFHNMKDANAWINC